MNKKSSAFDSSNKLHNIIKKFLLYNALTIDKSQNGIWTIKLLCTWAGMPRFKPRFVPDEQSLTVLPLALSTEMLPPTQYLPYPLSARTSIRSTALVSALGGRPLS